MLNNEWRFVCRQPLFWLAFSFALGFAVLLALGTHANNSVLEKQLQLGQMTWMMLCLPLFVGALAPTILLRDELSRMGELIAATATPAQHRLFYRYAILVILTLVCTALAMSLMSILSWLSSSNTALNVINSAASVHPTAANQTLVLLGISLGSTLLLAFPAILLLSSIALWLSQRFHSAILQYSVFALGWIAYVIIAGMCGAPMLAGSKIASETLFALMLRIDPYGITAVVDQFFAGHLSLHMDLTLWVNRVLTLLLAFAWFLLAIHVPRKGAGKTRLFKPNSPKIGGFDVTGFDVAGYDVAGQAASRRLDDAQSVAAVHTVQQRWPVLISLIKTSLVALLKTPINWLFLLLWCGVIFNEVLSGIDYAEPLAKVSADSWYALNRVSFDVVPPFAFLLMALFTWQLCWRDSRYRIAGLLAATPLTSLLLVLSQILCTSIMVLVLLSLTAISVFLAELVAGSRIVPIAYLQVLGAVGLPLLLISVLFVSIAHLCRRPLGCAALIFGLMLIKFTPLINKLGLAHPLWDIAATPLQAPDHYWGFAASYSSYWPFIGYWSVVCVLCVGLAVRFSHRGTGNKVPCTQAQGRTTWYLGACSLLVMALSIVMHLSLKAERPLMDPEQIRQMRANYERHYAHWATIPQPIIEHVDAKVDFFPAQGRADIRLHYSLRNPHQEPISQVLIGNFSQLTFTALNVAKAKLVQHDRAMNQWLFVLDEPLAGGASLDAEFAFSYQQARLWPAEFNQVVSADFSYLRGIPLLPVVGFADEFRLVSADAREKYGLAALTEGSPSQRFADPLAARGEYRWFTIDSEMSSSVGQHLISQGDLVASWQQDGRVHAQYHTPKAIRGLPAWLSVPLTPIQGQGGTNQLNILANTDSDVAALHLQAMQDTLSWFAESIRAYPHSALHLIAMPDLGPTGYALPQLLLINHTVGFAAAPTVDAGFDQRYRRTVHETAHQWFGHDLGNGATGDYAFLVESLSKYVELVVIEKRYGPTAMQALVDYERQRFRVGSIRNVSSPVPLVDAVRSEDMYSRATLAFARLRSELGDEPICAALRDVWAEHAYPQKPASSMDFVRALQARVGPEHQELVEQMLVSNQIDAWLTPEAKAQ
ncbi:MAG: M1 family metallopeptidase [Paraglaciecola sp.]|nr:M1 family metallopeptidase [Paraglaciecola sp.]NCT49407.1 M1 family metallopeptidase [Paraglaciecola sp.]